MPFTSDGDSVTVYDYVDVSTIEDGDCITYQNDILENVSVLTERDAVMVRGFSYITGDMATYFIKDGVEVGLWTV